MLIKLEYGDCKIELTVLLRPWRLDELVLEELELISEALDVLDLWFSFCVGVRLSQVVLVVRVIEFRR